MSKELAPNLDQALGNVRVSENMVGRIDQICLLTGLNRSDIVRIALAFFFFAFDQIREKGRITI